MGRAMLIICAGTLVTLGIISMSTSQRAKLMAGDAIAYANKTTAKNAAHTAIQMAMQEINEDSTWATDHEGEANAWESSVGNTQTSLYVEFINDDHDTNGYWEDDSLRMVSRATYPEKYKAKVISVFLVARFSNLVPDFAGALQLPTGYGTFTVDGDAHEINGSNPECPENKPPITVNASETKDALQNENLNMDGNIVVDNDLNYQPTDELIQRLKNSNDAVTVNSDYSQSLGSADNPGVFFMDGNVTLTGQQSEGYGIMVVQNDAYMNYEDSTGNTVDIRGNFEFNGLVIFENAQLFDGHGTPTINGSVLIGDTTPDDGNDIDVDIGGNIAMNYDCEGENYAKMAAADAEDQNKYKRIVTMEDTESL